MHFLSAQVCLMVRSDYSLDIFNNPLGSDLLIKDTNTHSLPSVCGCVVFCKQLHASGSWDCDGVQHMWETTQCLTCAFFRDGLQLVGFKAGFQVANRGGDQSHGVPRAVLCLLQHDCGRAAAQGKSWLAPRQIIDTL